MGVVGVEGVGAVRLAKKLPLAAVKAPAKWPCQHMCIPHANTLSESLSSTYSWVVTTMYGGRGKAGLPENGVTRSSTTQHANSTYAILPISALDWKVRWAV